MRKSLISCLVAFAPVVAVPTGPAVACACCAEPGTWRVSIVIRDKLIAALKATKLKTGVLAAGDPGSRADAGETMKARLVAATPQRLVIATPKGRLVVRPSKTAVFREVDISFAAGKGSAGSAKLLKSYAVLGQATLSGGVAKMFKAKLARATIAVRGTGNNCPNAQDMKLWQVRLRLGSRTIGHATFLPKK